MARHIHAQHLARSEITIETAFVDGWSIDAEMAWCIGMGAQMDGGVQSGQCDLVAPVHIAQQLARRRRISGPHL